MVKGLDCYRVTGLECYRITGLDFYMVIGFGGLGFDGMIVVLGSRSRSLGNGLCFYRH